jgi:PncC family amidohydrolase
MITDHELMQLSEVVGRALKQRGATITTAESCTGGWVAKIITDIAGSSAWFERGFVTYSNEAKAQMIGVQESTLEAHGAVSEPVVIEMAIGALRAARADYAISISGVAGPDGGSDVKPVGTVWGTNSLYIINMPLFIINELHLSEKLAGIMMGAAAGLEIPTMLIAGYYAKRFGKRFLMRIAAVAGLLFYVGMLSASSPAVLLGLQLLNAIYIGILAGIGMLYFQDLMPGQAGAATTLYTNTTRVGWIIAGSMAGVVAEIWSYHAVFWIALVMCVTTCGCLTRIKDI